MSLPCPAGRSMPRPANLWIPALIAALCLAYFIDPNPRLDFSRFDTRDAENYLALSRALVTGLGYTRSLDPHYYVPHTTWPPGWPILEMPVMALAGLPVDLGVVKLGTIAYGVAGIVLAYLYGRRLSRSPATQLGVPLLLGLNPYYWHFARMTDTEMPTVMWAMLALILAERGWGAAGAIRRPAAFAFGLVAGFGMLIRFSLVGALFLPLVYVVWLRPRPLDARGEANRYLAYAAGFVIPSLFWFVRNRFIDMSGLGEDGINQLAMYLRTMPVDPTSPLRGLAEIWRDARANMFGHAIFAVSGDIIPGLWSPQAWARIGKASVPVALLLCTLLLALSWRSRRNLPAILLYGSMAAVNLGYAAGGMTRLWVPVACLLAITLPVGAEDLAVSPPRWRGWLVGAVLVALAGNLGLYIVAHDARPYHDHTFAALAALFTEVRDHNRLGGNVLTPNPQAFTLLTGMPAPMTVPKIGVRPVYAYVILPNAEWSVNAGLGPVLAKNDVWSLVAFDKPLTLAAFRARYDCAKARLPAFAVVSHCLIW